ncbi:hypothetical protein MMC29_004837 [Sticta canariensis]|nr:hypothetical protein [Sticta canariensis]
MASIPISHVSPTPQSKSLNESAIHGHWSSLGSSYSTISSLPSQHSDSSSWSEMDSSSDESVGYDNEASIDTEYKADAKRKDFHDKTEGADIEARGSFGMCALDLASVNGNEKEIKLPFPPEAEIEAKDDPWRHTFDSTQLHLSRYSGSFAVPAPLNRATERRGLKIRARVKELTAYFVQEKSLDALLTIAFEKKSIGAEECQRKLADLLKRLSTELQAEALNDDQSAVARLTGSHAALISHRIRQIKETNLQPLSPYRSSDHDMNLPQVVVSHMPEEDEFSDNNGLQGNDRDQTSTDLGLKSFVTSSKSFSILRHRLSRFIQPDVFQSISIEMSHGLEPMGIQQATFQIQWELLKYCEAELQGRPLLAPVLTISGNAKTAYATSCDEYMNQFWPNTGLQTLQTLDAALEAAIGCEVYDRVWPCGLRFSVDFSARNKRIKDEDIIITVSGLKSQLIEIAQQLAWLSAVFRIPTYGKLALSDTILERKEGAKFNLFPLDLQEVDDREPPCWHPLLTNGLIAQGFPVPPRQEERGIELPFEAMIILAGIMYPVEYYDGMVLKGRSTILIPTDRSSNSVQWHLISGVPEKRLSTKSIADHMPESPWFETCDFELLRTAKTFLGYCKNAEIHLGTNTSSYGNIERSKAKYERFRLKTATTFPVTLGLSGMGFIGSVSSKFTLPNSLQATTRSVVAFLEDRIEQARDQPLLLYDDESKRGWLVPELSVILHIAHTWVSKQPDRSDTLNDIPHAAVSGNGGEAAYNAIRKGREIKLRTGLDGKPQFFIDLIKKLLIVLESRREDIIQKKLTSTHLLLTQPPLRGWDFIDIATFSHLHGSKEVPINQSSGGQWDIIPAGNPGLVVLFGKGFGEIIKPARNENICRSWNPIPEGCDYLTASVFCLEKLAAMNSIEPQRPKLTPKLHLHKPEGASLFEECEFGFGLGCNRLQELKRRGFRTPGPLERHGAVIFGNAKQWKRTSCTPVRDRVNVVQGQIPCHVEQSTYSHMGDQTSALQELDCSMTYRIFNDPPDQYYEPSTMGCVNEDSGCETEEKLEPKTEISFSFRKRYALNRVDDDGNSRSKMPRLDPDPPQFGG